GLQGSIWRSEHAAAAALRAAAICSVGGRALRTRRDERVAPGTHRRDHLGNTLRAWTVRNAIAGGQLVFPADLSARHFCAEHVPGRGDGGTAPRLCGAL